MRNLFLAGVSVGLMTLSVYLGASSQQEEMPFKIQLLDAETGKPLTGLVRIVGADRSAVQTLPGIYNRLKGLEKSAPVKGWYVIPDKGADTKLPQGQYTIEACVGLETELAALPLDLRPGKSTDIQVKLKRLLPLKDRQLVAGNTHLHLRDLTFEQADEYLRTIPRADGLSVLFISYLERHKDDDSYITNKYPVGDLKQFDVTGVLLSNGEEHRHNFKGYGQGYGHVMFLDINKFIKPASLGPGITGAGFDDPVLRTGIDDARKQGGTVIWCHNTFGYEDIPSALTGRLDALNVFDGSRKDSFEQTYYHLLNLGVRLPISSGADWFLYDFSRVYARVNGALTIKNWLGAVKAGRCQATNGPLLTLSVDGKEPGQVIALAKAGSVQVSAAGIGRHDFSQLELVHNGKVIKKIAAQKKTNHFAAELKHKVVIDKGGWLALRISSDTKNELGQPLFAHTSPVYVDLEGKKCFEVESAKALMRQVEEGIAAIRAEGKFSTPQAQKDLLQLHEDAIADLTKRINQQK